MFSDLRAQHGQFKDLAPVNDLVLAPLAQAGRAGAGALMDDDLIDLRTLAQGVALVALLPADRALAFEAQ